MTRSLSTGEARELADIVVHQRSLEPPVAVEDLVEEYSELRSRPFPDGLNVDAVLRGVGPGRARPLVILNTNRPRRRARFTLGHELGHILVPWHRGNIGCQPDEEDRRARRTEIVVTEKEADAFSARLLLPARYVERFLHEPIADILTAAELADLSVEATIRSLVDLMPTGWYVAHLATNGRTILSHHRSPGTPSLNLSRGGTLGRTQLAQFVGEEGLSEIHGQTVWWGKLLVSIEDEQSPLDWRQTQEQLMSSLGMDVSHASHDWQSITGIGAHANGATPGGTVEDLAAAMTIAFRKHDELRAFYSHARFPEYVRVRSWAFRSRNRPD